MTIYTSGQHFDVPQVDLLTLLFESEHCRAEESTPIHCDAADPSNVYTKAEARSYTKRLAHVLRHRFGIGARGPGRDVVTVASSGQSYLPIIFYGVMAAGGLYSAASSAFTVEELARQIRDGPSELVVCSRDMLEVARRAAASCGIPLSRVLVLESSPVWRLWDAQTEQDVIASGFQELDWERITDPRVLEERPVCLLYSSGTTGPPKGVPLSSLNLVAEAFIPACLYREIEEKEVAAGEPRMEWRTLAHLPASHIAGVQGYYINPFYAGGLTFWMRKFDFPEFVDYCGRYRITFIFSPPPVFLLISKSPAVRDQFRDLRHCITGAAPIGPELQAAASAKLGDDGTFLCQTYGLSETTGSVTIMPRDRVDESGSVSPLMPNVSMRIVDDSGKDVSPGRPGEILLKGPVIFRGYWGRPEETISSFVDGWFATGDIGAMRGDLLYIVDRKKELIKYKGTQVAPAELEEVLLSNPEILDAAVIGVAWQETEAPRAYVVADPAKITVDEVKAWVAKRLATYKQLRGGVVFVEAIPKSPAGKILRRELRDRAKKEDRAKL